MIAIKGGARIIFIRNFPPALLRVGKEIEERIHGIDARATRSQASEEVIATANVRRLSNGNLDGDSH